MCVYRHIYTVVLIYQGLRIIYNCWQIKWYAEYLRKVFRVPNNFMQSFWAWLSSLYSREVNLPEFRQVVCPMRKFDSSELISVGGFRKGKFKLNYTGYTQGTQSPISCLFKYLSVLWVTNPVVNEIFEIQGCIIILRCFLPSLSCIWIFRIHTHDI